MGDLVLDYYLTRRAGVHYTILGATSLESPLWTEITIDAVSVLSSNPDGTEDVRFEFARSSAGAEFFRIEAQLCP